jgi:hypothetical protein
MSVAFAQPEGYSAPIICGKPLWFPGTPFLNPRQNAERPPEYFVPTPHPERRKSRTRRLEVLAKFEFGIDCFQLPTIRS